MSTPVDIRAHHISLLAGMISKDLTGCNIPMDTATRVFALVSQLQESADRLCDDLDPCNPSGVMPPLYPCVAPVADYSSHGPNIVTLHPRR